MNNELLETFINLADTGSLSKTSEKIFISKPGVLKRINELEKNLGVRLFVRSNKGFVMTSQGRYFYRKAKLMLTYSHHVMSDIKNMKGDEPMVIRFGSSLLNPATCFNNLWSKYKLQYPNIKIDLVSFDDKNIKGEHISEYLGKKFDAFIGVFDSIEWYKKISFLKMKDCHFCVAVSPTHPLAHKKIIRPSDLTGYQFMMPKTNSSPSVTALEKYLVESNPKIDIVHTISNYNINIFNGASDNSIPMMSIACWSDLHPNLITIPIDSNIKIPYGIIYSKSNNKETEKFIDIIKDIIWIGNT